MHGNSWAKEQVDELMRLRETGESWRGIARIMGLTCNQVIGKKTRLGLPKIERPEQRGKKRMKRERKRVVAQDPADHLNGKSIPLPPVRISDLDIPLEQRKTLLELTPFTCRWPVGEPGHPDFFFCGAAVTTGRVYCAAHEHVAYSARMPRLVKSLYFI